MAECNAGLKVCDMGSCGGLMMPVFGDSEQRSSKGMRALVYLLGLFYLFMGVNVVSDYFMNAIEKITSHKVRVKNAQGNLETRDRWNPTVSNLTLLALGSSAPEILLSCIEMMKDEGYSGKLGPSTIVGSAAFNLFVIIGVCIASITNPADFRAIEGLAVYHVTMLFSLFAYFWLWFIVVVSSSDVVDVWEAAVALVMFPVLVFVSWLTDKGYLPFLTLDPLPRIAEEGTLEHHIVKHPRIRASQLHHCGSSDFVASSQRKTVNKWKEADEVEHEEVDHKKLPFKDNGKGILNEAGTAVIANEHGIIAFREDCYETKSKNHQRHEFTVDVMRRNGTSGKVTCQYDTHGLTAVQSFDYVQKKGTLEWNDGDKDIKQITIQILGKRIGEPADSFQLVLSDIKTDGSADVLAHFNPHDDGGKDKAICTITILNDNESTTSGPLGQCGALSERCVNWDNVKIGFEAWAQQIRLACSIDGEEDEEEDAEKGDEEQDAPPPGVVDYIFHILSLPWKMIFAVLCPPSNWGGGWLLFNMALFYIAICTAIVIDLASFFGCCAGIPEEVTAVTVVALGTSLPDMFASITSAREDENADASIVNVTGSNSVNVFLGIGLPWTVAALTWQQWGATDKWKSKYTTMVDKYPEGAFVVEAGNLGFTVLIFFTLAAMCIMTLRIRRIRCHGELGGPTSIKYGSALFLLCLWLTYVGCTIWKSSDAGKDSNGLAALVIVMCAAFGVLCLAVLVEILNWRKSEATRTSLHNAARASRQASWREAQEERPYEELELGTPELLERHSQASEVPIASHDPDLEPGGAERGALGAGAPVTIGGADAGLEDCAATGESESGDRSRRPRTKGEAPASCSLASGGGDAGAPPTSGGVDAGFEEGAAQRAAAGESETCERSRRPRAKEDGTRKRRKHRGSADHQAEPLPDVEAQHGQESLGRTPDNSARETAKGAAKKDRGAKAVSPTQYGRAAAHKGEQAERGHKQLGEHADRGHRLLGEHAERGHKVSGEHAERGHRLHGEQTERGHKVPGEHAVRGHKHHEATTLSDEEGGEHASPRREKKEKRDKKEKKEKKEKKDRE